MKLQIQKLPLFRPKNLSRGRTWSLRFYSKELQILVQRGSQDAQLDLQLSISSSEIIFNRGPPLPTSHSSPTPKIAGLGERGTGNVNQASIRETTVESIYRAAVNESFLCFEDEAMGKWYYSLCTWLLLCVLGSQSMTQSSRGCYPPQILTIPQREKMQVGRCLTKTEHRKLGSLQSDEWCSLGWKENEPNQTN